MGQKALLLVTCDTPPCAPFTGHNRKVYELMRAVCRDFEIRALCYVRDASEELVLRECWRGTEVSWTCLQRRNRFRHWRALVEGLSLPTVTRDFVAEASWVRRELVGREDGRLLIDFISGAPLLKYFTGSGTILSGHDCMSYLFQEERRYASGLHARLHLSIRRCFALKAEREFAHLAERVHVVSAQDAAELALVNPAVQSDVIPLAISGPGPAIILKSYWDRSESLIWGNLRSDLVRVGVRHLLQAAVGRPTRPFVGWLMVGKVSEKEARALVPELNQSGIRYLARVEDMSALLTRVRRLLLPDTGGTGQKTRTLDGIAHGCCVLGISEVFRGIGCPEERAYMLARDYEGLVDLAERTEDAEFAEAAARGRELFKREFTLDVLGRRWRALIGKCSFLTIKI